jgi:hypothetical protein
MAGAGGCGNAAGADEALVGEHDLHILASRPDRSPTSSHAATDDQDVGLEIQFVHLVASRSLGRRNIELMLKGCAPLE